MFTLGFILGKASPTALPTENLRGASLPSPTSSPQPPPLPEESAAELKKVTTSLQKMTKVLFQFGTTDQTLEGLINELKNQHQDPIQVRDSNPYTGTLILVRTQSPLPGTRYFHAQYFTDENKQSFPQHMSFEFRPGPEAMNQALEAVHEVFPQLEKPTQESADFIQWDLGNGHVLWIKRLDHQDISENPFNAYTEADIGSIRVAVEQALEGH